MGRTLYESGGKNALDFNASISYDCRMYKEDIAGSKAHAKMLARHGIISEEDRVKITEGLSKIKKKSTMESFPSPLSWKTST